MQAGNPLVNPPHDCAVIIIGAGPCGLMLAIELGRRGIATIVLEEKTTPARFPAANATQARTMEHYRRLGFAETVRAQGLPPDYPTDIAYFTRYARHELARFSLPSARAAREIVRTLSGSWSAAELPHRVSQMFVEQVLRARGRGLPVGVAADRTGGWSRSATPGPTSRSMPSTAAGGRRCARPTRSAPTAAAARRARRWASATSAKAARCATSWAGGCSPSISAAPKLYDVIPHPRAWMYWAVNRERRSFMATVNGRDEFNFHTQLKTGEDAEFISDAQAKACSTRRSGAELDVAIIARSSWNAGYTLVAERFQRGRIFLGGDAAHLFTPAGGLGYNTAVEDAVNLGWKLAAVLEGLGRPSACWTPTNPSGSAARPAQHRLRPRLCRFARPVRAATGTRRRNAGGDAARKLTGDHFNAHARAEFNIPGITFGGRYDGSPIVVPDGTAPPPDPANTYVPTACPGGRAPHLWLDDGRSLYDAFGFEFTLLRLGAQPADAAPFQAAAATMGIPLRWSTSHETTRAISMRRILP